MKHLMLALPATLFMATAGIAQTDTTAGASASGKFGTNWPLSVGTTFLTDDTSATVRPAEELSKGWQSLTPEDQTMIRTDCQAFLAAHGNDGTADDTAATDTSMTGTTTTGDAATSASAGYDMAEMKAICEAVGAL